MNNERKDYCHSEFRKYDIVIIGAGPAGLIGAIESHTEGKRSLIIEQMKRPALKLRITGSGSCNITNNRDKETFIDGFGKNGRFLRKAFGEFFSKELLEYFNELNVEFELERGGRYYPKSGKAESVVNALLEKIEELDIEILTGTKVVSINKNKEEEFQIKLQHKSSGKHENRRYKISAERILLAAGGRSYPATGSDGSGYDLAEGAGHTIVPAIPALVPLKGSGVVPEVLNGLNIKNCIVSVFSGEKKVEEKFGEMEFRDNEIAGPVVLKMSENIVRRIKSGEKVAIGIDFKPSLDHEKLDKRILRDTGDITNRTCSDILKRLLPMKAVDLFVDLTGIDPEKKPGQLTKDERKKLRLLLKDLRIKIKGSAPFSKSLVTAGGVSVGEIEQSTMESRITEGLYIAGEIIDLNGDTGGYNLQAAFSTGWLAGRSIKESFRSMGEKDG